MNILLAVLAAVGGYLLLSILRAILFPPKPTKPLEYKPRQVGGRGARRSRADRIRRTLLLAPCSSPGQGAPACLAAARCHPAPPSRPSLPLPVLLRISVALCATPPPSLTLPPTAPQLGPMTLLELSKYDGRDPLRPLLLAVRGRVFDVTMGRAFYGPGAAGWSAGPCLLRGAPRVGVGEPQGVPAPLPPLSCWPEETAPAPAASACCMFAATVRPRTLEPAGRGPQHRTSLPPPLQARATACLRARRWPAPWPRWRWMKRSATISAWLGGGVGWPSGCAGCGIRPPLPAPSRAAGSPCVQRRGTLTQPLPSCNQQKELPSCTPLLFLYRLDDLGKAELESLAEWERTFEGKYEVVGQVRFIYTVFDVCSPSILFCQCWLVDLAVCGLVWCDLHSFVASFPRPHLLFSACPCTAGGLHRVALPLPLAACCTCPAPPRMPRRPRDARSAKAKIQFNMRTRAAARKGTARRAALPSQTRTLRGALPALHHACLLAPLDSVHLHARLRANPCCGTLLLLRPPYTGLPGAHGQAIMQMLPVPAHSSAQLLAPLCAVPFFPQIVPPLKLTLEQLAQYGGSDPAKPLLLAVCGTILDVSAGGRASAGLLCPAPLG